VFVHSGALLWFGDADEFFLYTQFSTKPQKLRREKTYYTFTQQQVHWRIICRVHIASKSWNIFQKHNEILVWWGIEEMDLSFPWLGTATILIIIIRSQNHWQTVVVLSSFIVLTQLEAGLTFLLSELPCILWTLPKGILSSESFTSLILITSWNPHYKCSNTLLRHKWRK